MRKSALYVKVDALLRFTGVPFRWMPASVRFFEALRFDRRRRLRVAGRLLRPRGGQAVSTVDLLSGTLRSGAVLVGPDSIFVVSDSATFDPLSSRFIIVPGDSVRAWRVDRLDEVGLPLVDWVDASGRVVRREHAFGVVIERSPFEVNYTNYQAALRDRSGGEATTPAGMRRVAVARRGPPTDTATRRVVVSRWDGPAWPGSDHAPEALDRIGHP